jgi:ATP-dependent RNA helicase DeaD
MQITNDLDYFLQAYMQGSICCACVWWHQASTSRSKRLARGGQIVVGTPGRVLDLIKRKKLLLNLNIKYHVLDEADEMLNMGFKDDLDARSLAVRRLHDRSMLFSATMPKGIARFGQKIHAECRSRFRWVSETLAQRMCSITILLFRPAIRYRALKRIVDYYPSIYGIVFCRTSRETQDVAEKLMQDGYNADALAW